ncbi:MAG TPA: hypothetical protein V6D20_07735 [Candidatus Obscuribacterales bacterium]
MIEDLIRDAMGTGHSPFKLGLDLFIGPAMTFSVGSIEDEVGKEGWAGILDFLLLHLISDGTIG